MTLTLADRLAALLVRGAEPDTGGISPEALDAMCDFSAA
jgi:hypothetical protein